MQKKYNYFINSVVVNRNKAVIAFLLICIYFVLDYNFTKVIYPNFGEFSRFLSHDQNSYLQICSLLVPLLLSVSLIFLNVSDYGYSILCLILLLIIFPSSILARHLGLLYPIFPINIYYFFSIFFFIRYIRLRIVVPQIRRQNKLNLQFILILILILPFLFVYLPHLDLSNLLLVDIYQQRAVQKTYNNTYMGYLFAPLSNVLIPMLLIFSIMHRRFLLTLVAIAMMTFMFLVGAHKSVFFGMLLLIYFYFGDYGQKLKFFLVAILVLLISGAFLYARYHDFFLTALITRRIFFLPSLLEIGYFDFFHGS